MATMIKRILAMVIALTLCVGMFAIPALAAEEDTPMPEVTVTVTQTSETTTSGGISTTTDTTEKTWSGSETTDNVPVAPDDEDLTTTGAESTTTVTGSETQVNSQSHDSQGRLVEESGKVEGSETITVTTEIVSEKQEDGTTTTVTTDNPYETVSETPGQWTDAPGISQPDTYSDVDIKQKPGDVTLEMTQSDKTDQETVAVVISDVVADNINLPAAGTTESINDDGDTVITEVTYIYDKNDPTLVIGYTTHKTIVSKSHVEDDAYTRGESSTGDIFGLGLEEDVTSKTDFILPEKPTGSETTDEATGNVTTVTVEDVLENDQVVGYKSITEVRDTDGNLISTASETLYGTTIKTNTLTKTTEQISITETTLTKNKVTTTEYAKFYDSEGYELVIYNGQWIYKSQLSAVREGKAHGSTDITTLTPTSVVLNGKSHVINRSDSTVTPAGSHSSGEEYNYNYTGVRGEGSHYAVKTSNSYDSLAHMFQMKDEDGNTFYVYCVDFATTATPNYNYTMENVADATYYGASESAHIQAIGMYGYWGTSGNATGSLKTLKANLTAARKEAAKKGRSFYLTQKQIDALTEGEALTATQAAFWTFGNSGSTTIDAAQNNARITGLYQWLINLEAPDLEATEFIDGEDFAQSASITVKDEVAEDTYNTDITFSLAVTPDAKSDDLLVHVIVGGKIVETKRLAGDDSKTRYGSITPDTDGNYTIENLKLASGVTLTLNLSGTQHIDEGVYIYTSEELKGVPSQTMVGLASGERTVNLTVDMQFTVTKPNIQLMDPGAQPRKVKTDVLTERKTDTETVTAVTYDVQVTSLITEETARAWDSQWAKSYSYPTETSEEPLGQSDVPKTGDISAVWAVLSVLSAGGMFLLRKRED